MYSIATGTMPAPMMADTVSPASSTESKPNSTGCAPSAARRMRTVASVTMPSCPSDPTTRPSRSSPPASMCWPPMSTTVPSTSTMRTPSTLLVVTPYFRQWAPPEFIAMLPAMVQASCDEGSGA